MNLNSYIKSLPTKRKLSELVTPIKNISTHSRDFKNIQKDEDLKRIRKSKSSESSSITAKDNDKPNSDKVNISAVGKKMLEQKADASRYFEDIKNLENINRKSTEQIKRKIATGFYSKPSVIDKISDAILSLPLFSEKNQASTENTQEIEDKSKGLSKIKRKLDSGDYNSDEVLDVIVDRLLESLENDTDRK